VCQAQSFACVKLEEVDGLGHVGIGFGPVLADFVGQPCGELEFSVADDGRSIEQKRRAHVDRDPAPGMKGPQRGVHGFLRVFGAGFLVDAYDLRRPGGVQRGDLAGGLFAMAADDQIVFAA